MSACSNSLSKMADPKTTTSPPTVSAVSCISVWMRSSSSPSLVGISCSTMAIDADAEGVSSLRSLLSDPVTDGFSSSSVRAAERTSAGVAASTARICCSRVSASLFRTGAV
jgi:hypothetical protein